jgi:hypothetical protein
MHTAHSTRTLIRWNYLPACSGQSNCGIVLAIHTKPLAIIIHAIRGGTYSKSTVVLLVPATRRNQTQPKTSRQTMSRTEWRSIQIYQSTKSIPPVHGRRVRFPSLFPDRSKCSCIRHPPTSPPPVSVSIHPSRPQRSIGHASHILTADDTPPLITSLRSLRLPI